MNTVASHIHRAAGLAPCVEVCHACVGALAWTTALALAATAFAATAPEATAPATTAAARDRSGDPPSPCGGSWSDACTVRPLSPKSATFGPAIAMSEGRLWIGPTRDMDLGVGPPQVTALRLGDLQRPCPTQPRVHVLHPKGDWTAAFGAAIGAYGACAVIGAPAAGCAVGSCNQGEAWLAHALPDGTAHTSQLASPQPCAGSAFGAAVALGEHWVAVASPRATIPAFEGDPAGTFHAGCVDVYERFMDAAGHAAATHRARLVSPHPQQSGWFGAAVAIDGDWLAIGEPGWDGETLDEGRVHVLRWRDHAWELTESLRAPAGAFGWHGASLALAGDVLIAGAPIAARPRASDGRTLAKSADHTQRPAADRGAVAAYVLRESAWHLAGVFAPVAGGHGFGCAVALDATSRVAVVGSSADSASARFGGAAWVVGVANGCVERLPCPAPLPDEGLGAGVAIADGIAAVSVGGAPERSPPAPGRVHLLARPSPSTTRSPRRHRRWPQPRSPP